MRELITETKNINMKNTETTPKALTIDFIKEQSMGDIYADIRFAETFYPRHPESTPKPRMKEVKTAKDAREYASLLEAWEKKDVEYKKEVEFCDNKFYKVQSIIEDYIKEMSGLNKIPQKAQSKVWSKAYSDGHSSGYGEVYSHLRELVELFD